MTRTTGVPSASHLAKKEIGRPAQIETTSLLGGTIGPSSARSAPASCGFTAIGSTSASATAVTSLSTTRMPYRSASSAARSARRSVAIRSVRSASPTGAGRRAASRRSCRRRSPRWWSRLLLRAAALPATPRHRDSVRQLPQLPKKTSASAYRSDRDGLELRVRLDQRHPHDVGARAAPSSCPSRPRARRRWRAGRTGSPAPGRTRSGCHRAGCARARRCGPPCRSWPPICSASHWPMPPRRTWPNASSSWLCRTIWPSSGWAPSATTTIGAYWCWKRFST